MVMNASSPHNCRINVKQGPFVVQDNQYIGVIVPHEAENFSLRVQHKGLDYEIYDGAVMTTTGIMVFRMNENSTYLIIGTYKTLEENQKVYRNALVDRGFDIDQNILIIKELA